MTNLVTQRSGGRIFTAFILLYAKELSLWPGIHAYLSYDTFSLYPAFQFSTYISSFLSYRL
jgi:hypothetical protein